MSTEAQRKAVRTYQARRREAGNIAMTVWLSPEDRATLLALRPGYQSNDAVFAAGLRALKREATNG